MTKAQKTRMNEDEHINNNRQFDYDQIINI